jgi:hypothetical protein
MKFDTLIRFAYIETQLYWGEGIAATDLMNAFQLTRQTAQNILNDYRERYPKQMRYDSSLKRHVSQEDFLPHHINPDTMPFLEYLLGQDLRAHYLNETDWSDIELNNVDRLLRPKLSRQVIQPILSALRHQKTLLIEYQPVAPDEIQARVISPNHLVFVDNRYHLHAYCHVKQRHLDFVLSRILYVEPAYEDWVSSSGSREWQEWVTLRFRPNRELPQAVQDSLLRGHPKNEKGNWEIRCRKNEAFYVRQKLLKAVDSHRGMPLWIEVEE